MEWQDIGIVISVRPHGESSAIVELLTRENGRHLGLVKGGRSRVNRPLLQVGNLVGATWRARLDEHLGFYTLEAIELRAARVMESRSATLALVYGAALTRLLPERDPHQGLFDSFNELVDGLDNSVECAMRVIRFEILMLTELGFGLDLSECALTGTHTNLTYVSPRSGRAVSKDAAGIWANRLLPLPAFLVAQSAMCAEQDIERGAQLTAYFFRRWVFEPRNIPEPDARALYFRGIATRAAQEG